MTFLKLFLVAVAPFVFLPVTASAKVPFSYSTLTYKKPRTTERAPAPTPAPVLRNQLFRRDQRTCGVPEGYYTDAPPVCSGSASFCTFTASSGYQGCCQDESPDYCTFYTACYAYSDQASCTGSCTSSGLVCPSSAPECTQYSYQWEQNPLASSWTGFACGLQQATIYAYAVNGIEQSQAITTTPSDTSSSTPSASSSSSLSSSSTTRRHPAPSTFQSSSSLTLHPPPTGPRSTTSTAASVAAASSSGASDLSVSQSHPHTSAIAGGVVGGVAVLVLLAGALILWRVHRKRKERSRMAPMKQRELGHPWQTQ